MRQPRQNKALKYFITSILLLLLFAQYNGAFDDVRAPVSAEQKIPYDQEHDFALSERAKTHILYGDHSGGGHRFGTGKACKSEFPKDWNDERIVSVVQNIAANDNIAWKRQDNGYLVSQYLEDGIAVRVVMSNDKTKVITAYPVNVKRNPCPPRPANDNYNR